MTDFAPTTRRKIAVSSWVTLAAFVVAVWPLFDHVRVLLTPMSEFGNILKSAFDYSYNVNVGQFGFSDYILITFAEPVVMIAAVVTAFTVRNKVARALPGILYALGFVVFWVLNFANWSQTQDETIDAWGWTVGYGAQAYAYVASILLALAGSIIALLEKPANPGGGPTAGPNAGGPGVPAPTSTPIGFDTQTGRPIYGYDVNTGEPILG